MYSSTRTVLSSRTLGGHLGAPGPARLLPLPSLSARPPLRAHNGRRLRSGASRRPPPPPPPPSRARQQARPPPPSAPPPSIRHAGMLQSNLVLHSASALARAAASAASITVCARPSTRHAGMLQKQSGPFITMLPATRHCHTRLRWCAHASTAKDAAKKCSPIRLQRNALYDYCYT